MDNNAQFLSDYFHLLPNDIIIHIINLLPPQLVECLMTTNGFDHQVYHEFLKNIIVSTALRNNKVTLNSVFGSNDTIISLESWPTHCIPHSVHIIGKVDEIENYITQNFNYLKPIKDIRICIYIQLGGTLNINSFCKLIRFPNLSLLTIKFSLQNRQDIKISELEVMFKIESNKDYLKPFLSYVNQFTLVHGYDLHELSIKWVGFSSTFSDFNTLESITLNGSHLVEFPDLSFNWPTNIKSIVIVNTSITDDTIAKFSNWPAGLESLTLKNNQISKFSSIGELPENLKYLEIGSEPTSFRAIPIQVENIGQYECYYNFPKSLTTLKLEGIEFYKYPNCYIEFPPNLKRLEMTRCLKSINHCNFPPSLIYLELSHNEIDELISFKNWQQLINLKTLKLSNTYLTRNSVLDWLPPKNINYLDLSSTKINSLNIAIFKEENKTFTHSLLVVNFAYCFIPYVPHDFYLPENVYQFKYSKGYFISINAHVIISNKRMHTKLSAT
ncbi:hypothetical protein DFJ63DRAFT_338280 [Scheffersomyces coipomensis]|uniref:uncharacterized protein n=1 Tax=Scheffersomyces coipomensis TaxID=1788519 RepID=UPI00315CF4E3